MGFLRSTNNYVIQVPASMATHVLDILGRSPYYITLVNLKLTAQRLYDQNITNMVAKGIEE